MQAANRLMLMGRKNALSFGADLLSGLSWTAGASTTYSTASGLARATDTVGGANPRITKGPITITAGKTYKFGGSLYKRTNISAVLRVHNAITLAAGSFFDGGLQTSTVNYTGVTFLAVTSGTAYLGFVATTSVQGDYGEIDEAFTLQESL